MIGKKLRNVEGGGLMFRCPGCGGNHMVKVGDGPGPRWGWNGSGDAPTFTPSILVRSGHYAHGGQRGNCWCTCDDPGRAFRCAQCHSFVTDGRIQFLSDCTHALAGQTVDLPDWVE